ncbi:MAG: hypothetical protein RLZZ367_934 [Bacteroidota bacterium]|jgi:hypothetical protein
MQYRPVGLCGLRIINLLDDKKGAKPCGKAPFIIKL